MKNEINKAKELVYRYMEFSNKTDYRDDLCELTKICNTNTLAGCCLAGVITATKANETWFGLPSNEDAFKYALRYLNNPEREITVIGLDEEFQTEYVWKYNSQKGEWV